MHRKSIARVAALIGLVVITGFGLRHWWVAAVSTADPTPHRQQISGKPENPAVRQNASSAAVPDWRKRRGLVGLLSWRGIGETANAPNAEPATLKIFDAPFGEEIGTVTSDGMQLSASADSCKWVGSEEEMCPTWESGYEQPALAALATEPGGWVKVITSQKGNAGWVRSDEGFAPLAELLSADRLTYVTPDWDGKIYPDPSAAAFTRFAAPSAEQREVHFKTLDTQVLDGKLWLKIQLISNPCSEEEVRELATGWIPAEAPDGAVWAWFYSRGC
jgi:hypothetical protein